MLYGRRRMAKKKALRKRTRVEQNAFVKGLITEASPLTFPDNASLAEQNFELNRDGSRQRRLGMSIENGGIPIGVFNRYPDRSKIDTIVWSNASNNRNFNIAVVKVDNLFYFFDADAPIVTKAQLNGGKPEAIPELYNTLSSLVTYDYTFAHGKLFITTGEQHVYICSYNPNTKEVTVEQKRLEVRDLFGIEEVTLDVDERPALLTSIHEYNLRNQGWLDDIRSSDKGIIASPSEMQDSIQWTFDKYPGKYPSNADMVWANKAADSTPNAEAIGTYSPSVLRSATYGAQAAPKGHHIIDLFNRGASRATFENKLTPPLTDPPLSELTKGGIVAITTYMGRVVYAINEVEVVNEDGRSPSLGSMVMFSFASDNKDSLVKCYSKLDPTSGEDFAQLATDGGWFTLAGIGNISGMEAMGNSLFIFSNKGVWQINGGDRAFSATNINQTKVTSIGSIGRDSTVIAEDKLFYLTDAGIYVLSPGDDPAGAVKSENITQTTIQTFLDDMPENTKIASTSTYDKFARKVRWLFGDPSFPNDNFYGTELIFDLNLKAFYPHVIGQHTDIETSKYLIGFLERPSLVRADVSVSIVAGSDNIVATFNGNTRNVINTIRTAEDEIVTSTKYWSLQNTGNTNAILQLNEYNNLKFEDWDRIDAPAFLLTGHATAGDSASFKRIPYITTHMRRTETNFIETDDGFLSDNPSSCNLQVHWEWTNDPNSGRWSNPQQIYRLPRTFIPDTEEFKYGHTVVTTKNRLRGKGRAFSLLYTTDPRKDCHLYGWSLELDAEVSV